MFNRVFGSYKRDGTVVDFPITNLDLTEYVIEGRDTVEMYQKNKEKQGTGKDDKPPKLLYDLYAISNHHGGMGGGHYTAYVKNADD